MTVNTFKWKLQLLSTKLQRQDLHYLESLPAELQHQGKDAAQLNNASYIEQVKSIVSQFERYSTDFASVEPVATYMFWQGHLCGWHSLQIGNPFPLGHYCSGEWNSHFSEWRSDEVQGICRHQGWILAPPVRGEVSKHKEMCLLPVSPAWFDPPICLFPH